MKQKIKSHLTEISAWGLIAFGVILRIRQYLLFRSLWYDEACLALNIVERDFNGLLKPLYYGQGAPLGFLWTEKLIITIFGKGDIQLRLIPFFAGCASLILFYLIAKQILYPPGLLTALALFAVSPTLVYYSSEVKQYSSDVFTILVLFWLALEVFRTGKFGFKKIIILSVVGVLGLFFSHPAIFGLAAIGTIMFIDNVLKRDRTGLISTITIGLIWLLFFGLLYMLSLRYLTGNSGLIDYWKDSFSINLLDGLRNLFSGSAGFEMFLSVLLIMAIIGMIVLFKKNWKIAGVIVLVFTFSFLASRLHAYPFAGRLMLFSVPFLAILPAATVDWVWNIQLHPKQLFFLSASLLAGLMLYAPFTTSINRFISPIIRENIRPVMSYLKTNYKQGDLVYVYLFAKPAYRYYAPSYGLPEQNIIRGIVLSESDLIKEMDQLRGHNRVWLIFSHISKDKFVMINAALSHLNKIGHRKRRYFNSAVKNVYLYLYDLK